MSTIGIAALPPWPPSASRFPADGGLAGLVDLPQEALERQKEAAGVLAKLDQALKSATADRKAAAEQKLEQARARLRMLRMLGGDPKSTARQAREIAREIREAAREYAAALKAEAGSAAAPAPPPETAPAPPADGQAGQADRAPPEGSEAGPQAPESAPTDRAAVAAAYRNAAAEITARSDKRRGEREVVERFKQAADEARRLIEEAIARLKAGKAGAAAVDDMERARKAMLDAVGDLDGALAAATGSAEAGGPTVDLVL